MFSAGGNAWDLLQMNFARLRLVIFVELRNDNPYDWKTNEKRGMNEMEMCRILNALALELGKQKQRKI